MEIGTRVQLIKNAVSNIQSFLMFEKGVVTDREHGVRAGIKGNWYLVEFDKNHFAVPYWCGEGELKIF